MLGSKLGERYKILAEIGQGGMATVYRAFDEVLGRDVAVKVLHAHLVRDSELCTRFQQEASIAAKLDHPNIVKIFDYGQDEEGRGFIVSELIKGQNFHKLHVARLKAGRGLFPVVVSAMIIEEILNGLCSAHEMKVIHRDVKPDNVMISRAGHIKLADFGIAKNVSSTLTQVGKFLGSPSYSSPEQVKGLDLDFRTDLFSTGIIFYEALTDRLPFQGRSATEVMLKISKGEHTPLGEVAPYLPKPIIDVVEKALRLEASERFSSTAEMIAAVRTYLAEQGVPNSRSALEEYALHPEDFQTNLQRTQASLPRRTEEPVTQAAGAARTQEASVSAPHSQTLPGVRLAERNEREFDRLTRFGVTTTSSGQTATGLYPPQFRRQRAPESRPLQRLGTSERKLKRMSRRTARLEGLAEQGSLDRSSEPRAFNTVAGNTLESMSQKVGREQRATQVRVARPTVRTPRRLPSQIASQPASFLSLLASAAVLGAFLVLFLAPTERPKTATPSLPARAESPPVPAVPPVPPHSTGAVKPQRPVPRDPEPPVRPAAEKPPAPAPARNVQTRPGRQDKPDKAERPEVSQKQTVATNTSRPVRGAVASAPPKENRPPQPPPPLAAPVVKPDTRAQRLASRPAPSARIGLVVLRTVPSDLPVLVNGIEKPVANRTATSAAFEVPPGKSTITIRPAVVGGTKYQGFEKQIFVEAGDTFDLGLIRLTPLRTLRLRIKGPGILAKVNGDPYSLKEGELALELPEGKVNLEVRSSSGKSLQRLVQLQGDDVTLEANLE